MNTRKPKLFIFILIWVPLSWILAQDIQVTFSATGTASSIDSIRATNLTSGQSIVMPGNQTLTLRQASTGIDQPILDDDQLLVYPNPGYGTANVSFRNPFNQDITLMITDMQGRCLDKFSQVLIPGEHHFNLSFTKPEKSSTADA